MTVVHVGEMEAKFGTGLVVKNLIDAVKDLINDANWVRD